ncbi:MAG TPA: S8 family serine peptidase [Caldilineaceae bacterium]|nr:S8 family serine peptidase [Caldilineaceae bacterium]
MPTRAQATPSPSPVTGCEGLIIQTGTPEMSPREALLLAQRVIAESLSGRWAIEPLGRYVREFLLVKPPGTRQISVARGWELAAQLRRHRDVAAAEPALVVPGLLPEPVQLLAEDEQRAMPATLAAAPLDCSDPTDWALALCSLPAAWEMALPSSGYGKRYGEGIIVGHPDTGYTQHPEIWDQARLLAGAGYDFETPDSNPQDPLAGLTPGHGTSTASVIMSSVSSEVGGVFVTGAAPSASLVPLRVATSVIHLSFANLTKALYFAADQGHHVISMSLGGPVGSPALLRAIRYALDRGVILLAAAGNVWPWVVYPAKYDEVIAVAACNCRRGVWSLSSKGPAVDASAPGESVWVAQASRDGAFSNHRSSGTSFAVALTAGVCALWLAYHGRDYLLQRYGAAQLAAVFKELLLNTGVDTPAGWDRTQFGAGIVNAQKVLAAPLPDTPPAGGVRAQRASPAPADDSSALLDYFPDADPTAVHLALLRLLQTDERQLAPLLAEHGDELQFHLATNPVVRDTIRQLASAGAERVQVLRQQLATDPQFVSEASKELQQLVQAGNE